jgi:hypothetical protein
MHKRDTKKKLNITIKRQQLELLRVIASEEDWDLQYLIDNYFPKSKKKSEKSG